MSATSPTLYLLSLGCPKNRVDSEVMLGSLLDDGYKLVDQPEEAEVILINSCALIGEAKQESIDAILEHAQHMQGNRSGRSHDAGPLAVGTDHG